MIESLDELNKFMSNTKNYTLDDFKLFIDNIENALNKHLINRYDIDRLLMSDFINNRKKDDCKCRKPFLCEEHKKKLIKFDTDYRRLKDIVDVIPFLHKDLLKDTKETLAKIFTMKAPIEYKLSVISRMIVEMEDCKDILYKIQFTFKTEHDLGFTQFYKDIMNKTTIIQNKYFENCFINFKKLVVGE